MIVELVPGLFLTPIQKAYGVAWLGWWHKIVAICKQDINNVEKDSQVRKCNE